MSGKGGKCFVATAAYGSELSQQVNYLRLLRDKRLMKSEMGRNFIRLYYRVGPLLAASIEYNSVKRALVRTLLWPIVSVAKRLK